MSWRTIPSAYKKVKKSPRLLQRGCGNAGVEMGFSSWPIALSRFWALSKASKLWASSSPVHPSPHTSFLRVPAPTGLCLEDTLDQGCKFAPTIMVPSLQWAVVLWPTVAINLNGHPYLHFLLVRLGQAFRDQALPCGLVKSASFQKASLPSRD